MANLVKTMGMNPQQMAREATQPKPIPAGSPEAKAAQDISAIARPTGDTGLREKRTVINPNGPVERIDNRTPERKAKEEAEAAKRAKEQGEYDNKREFERRMDGRGLMGVFEDRHNRKPTTDLGN